MKTKNVPTMKKIHMIIIFILLLPLLAIGQLKQTKIIDGFGGDTLIFPLDIDVSFIGNPNSYTELVFCLLSNNLNGGYSNSIQRAMRINFKDTITYKVDAEQLMVWPIIDNKGKVVRLLIDLSDFSRFRKTYSIGTFVPTENREVYSYGDTLIYRETIDALNEAHLNWYIPANAKEGQYFKACNVTLYYPTKRKIYGGGWWAIPTN